VHTPVSIQFRYARPEDYPRISAFLDEVWAKNHIYVRSRTLFDWTFQRPLYWDEGMYSFTLAEDGGELIGILGGIPYTFNVFGKSLRGVWIVNYAVRPTHRKGSAAFQLLSQFRNENADVVIASGLNPSTTTIYRVLRGQVLPEAPRHFVCLPHAVERFARLLTLANPTLECERAMALGRALQCSAVGKPSLDWGTSLTEHWDVEDWPAIAAGTVGAARDTAYLKWRYLQHPVFEYQFITIPEGRRSGLVVWRLETIRQQVEENRVDVDRIGRVVEYLPCSNSNAEKLTTVLLQELTNANVIGADFYGYHGATRSLLSDNQFRSCDTHPDGALIPSRFQPLDPQSGGMLNAMFAPLDLPQCGVGADCPWYWTKSDSDQDRPN